MERESPATRLSVGSWDLRDPHCLFPRCRASLFPQGNSGSQSWADSYLKTADTSGVPQPASCWGSGAVVTVKDTDRGRYSPFLSIAKNGALPLLLVLGTHLNCGLDTLLALSRVSSEATPRLHQVVCCVLLC